MLNDSSSGSSEEPPSSARLNSLKDFVSPGRGFWTNISDQEWNDWHWQLKHRIVSLEQLERLKLQPKPPIIITTGSNIIGQEWAAAHGCAGLVRKPIDTEDLLAQIRRCLGETA